MININKGWRPLIVRVYGLVGRGILVILATHFHLVTKLKMSEALFPVAHTRSWPVQKKIINVTCMDYEWEMVLRR